MGGKFMEVLALVMKSKQEIEERKKVK